jgi:hypothetical protein
VLRQLGEPLEVLTESPGVIVWRYDERAQLRGCQTALYFGVIPWDDIPIVTADARVHLPGRRGVETSRKE